MSGDRDRGASGGPPTGSQTLLRGLDVIEAVAQGATTLTPLASHLGLTRSTTHRLATSLVERGYLAFVPREGYRLGAKLLELGHLAHAEVDIVRIARPFLEELAIVTEDAVHFGILDQDQALYLDKMPGRRRIAISSRIGDRHPLTSTGLGKALILDYSETYWAERFAADKAQGARLIDWDQWIERMRGYAVNGAAFDLEENEDRIRCVSAPVRNAAGAIVGAFSVSSAAQYMSDDRMAKLAVDIAATAQATSHALGWQPER